MLVSWKLKDMTGLKILPYKTKKMNLKEKLISSYSSFEDDVNINSNVLEIRSKALHNFEKLGFPTKKLEAWKYTSLNSNFFVGNPNFSKL